MELKRSKKYEIEILQPVTAFFYDEPINQHIFQIGQRIIGQFIDKLETGKLRFWIDESIIKGIPHPTIMCQHFNPTDIRIHKIENDLQTPLKMEIGNADLGYEVPYILDAKGVEICQMTRNDEEMAQHIIKCVNSHNELINACKKALAARIVRDDDVVDAIKTAIKNATNKT